MVWVLRTRVFRVLAALTAVAGLQACTTSPDPREASELASIRQSNLVPKSNARTVVRAFNNHCLGNLGQPAVIPGRLRDVAYVEAETQEKMRVFVVDDRRPLVMFRERENGLHCVTAARARTGQADRIDGFVASTYPKAKAMRPADLDVDAERVWAIANNPLTMIYTKREPRPLGDDVLMLGVIEFDE
ncbi:MAG: hypothetical protein AAGB15_01310 [Pseudomonadota bacterium]